MNRLLYITCLILIPLTFTIGELSAAQPQTTEFSADLYQKGQGMERNGRIYIAKGRMRSEMSQGGQTIIQIVDTDKKLGWMIMPAQKSYMEQQLSSNTSAITAQSQGGDSNPCMGMKGAQCKKVGEEKISGRLTVKWYITFNWQGKTQKSTQWIDKERGIPLKQALPDGQQLERKMVGLEQLSGRAVEKWVMSMQDDKEGAKNVYSWYDPQLNLALREEMPGGFVREMRNVKIGPQDPKLFTIPAGYKKMTPQMRPPANK